jgi:hypothetical protein
MGNTQKKRGKTMKRLTAQEIIENNKRIIKENNLKNWQEVHDYTLTARLEKKGE